MRNVCALFQTRSRGLFDSNGVLCAVWRDIIKFNRMKKRLFNNRENLTEHIWAIPSGRQSNQDVFTLRLKKVVLPDDEQKGQSMKENEWKWREDCEKEKNICVLGEKIERTQIQRQLDSGISCIRIAWGQETQATLPIKPRFAWRRTRRICFCSHSFQMYVSDVPQAAYGIRMFSTTVILHSSLLYTLDLYLLWKYFTVIWLLK